MTGSTEHHDSESGCPLCAATTTSTEMTWQDFLMLRCRHCGLVYSNRRQVPAELYDRAYEDLPSYHGYFAQAGKRPGRRHIAWAWRHFFGLARSRGRLLDIGCATGVFLNAAQERGWVSVGIDVSPIATRVAKELATGAEVLVGTVESCAFDDASFDAVTAWEVLEHVPDPKPFIAEILRILKPGGYLALSTPNWESPWERVTTDVNRRPPYHLTYWSPGPLTRLFTDCGFVAPITRRKPIAWGEEVGRKKWFYLPIAIMRSLVLDQKGNRLFGLARKPGPSPQKEPPLS